MEKSVVRIGLAGAGPWGQNLARAFRASPRAEITAVCDLDPSRLSDLRAFGTSVSVASFQSLIVRNDVDAVVVATPAATHAGMALSALEIGRHVFVEKPMALSSADTARLCTRAREQRCTLMVGHVLLYHPAFEALLARIQRGDLGEIVRVESRRLSVSRRARQDGAWWSLAPHDVSLMRRILGSEPTAIAVRALPSAGGGPDHVSARMSFPDRRSGSIEVGFGAASDIRRVLVIGTRKTALFDDRATDAKLVVFDTRSGSNQLVTDPAPQGGIEIVPIANDEPLVVEASRFVEAVLDGRPVPSDGIEGHAVTSILEAGAASLAMSGEPHSIARAATASPLVDLQRLSHGSVALPFDTLL